jgi:hypothetical protein
MAMRPFRQDKEVKAAKQMPLFAYTAIGLPALLMA